MRDRIWRAAALLGISFSLMATARAGDILRGGATVGSGPRRSAAVNANSVRVDQVQANARESLERTNQTAWAVQAMQQAAREMAVRNGNGLQFQDRTLPKVPNGLIPGGLQVAPGVPKNLAQPGAGENAVLWRGAKLPTQSAANGRTAVTVQQTKPQAVLNWQTFNVGKETTLRFDQSAGKADQSKWIAFNKVNDPSGQPSQILGAIEAPGQVYVINRNGILFGGSSQINLNTLVASALPLNDSLLTRGILNNPDAQFLFSALPLAAGSKGTPAFTPTISDNAFNVSSGAETYTLKEQVALNATNTPLRDPEFRVRAADGSSTKLISGTDYTLVVDSSTRKATATFTAAGLQKVGDRPVSTTYTPVVVKSGDVVVQAGARINSPANAEGNGGRVMLVGANVRNEGMISTPAGQTILAAGLQVGVNAHRSSDPSLRGLDVYVGAVTSDGAKLSPAGTGTNTGLIETPRGNATIAGKTVQQLSVIDSRTSTALNGRVDLLASYGATPNPNYDPLDPAQGPIFLNRSSGTVEIGEGSVTRVLPEWESTETAVGTQLALPSQINIEGRTVHFDSGSEIFAPNANVTVRAGNWLNIGNTTALSYTGGQIYFDSGAILNVAGSTNIPAPISENILTLELRGAELANSPTQRDGFLRGPTINVDARQTGIYNGAFWIGTPLADVSGYLGIIERSVGQLTTAGGTVTLNAGESVIIQAGSKIDVSGGWVKYEGGMVQTTRLFSGGQLIDMANATPDRIYAGIYTGTSTFTNAKYGITETFHNPLALLNSHYEAAYIHGANAGTIDIIAPSVALDGSLLGYAVQGPRQRNETTFAPAKAGTLYLTFRAQELDTPYSFVSPTPPNIVFANNGSLPPANAFSVDADGLAEELRKDRKTNLILSPELLTESGFGTLKVDNSDGTIRVPRTTELKAPLKGSITLRGAKIDIDGSVTAPGGTLDFSTFNFSPYALAKLRQQSQNRVTPAVDPKRGTFTVGEAATLSAAGLITDYRPGVEGALDAPPLLDGGSITINAFSADLAAGSVIGVSGGLSVSAMGRRTYGAGGSIVINAGREPDFASLFGGKLVLGSTLQGYSGVRGGSLTVQAPLIQIGGPRPVPIASPDGPQFRINDTLVARDELLYLTPDFFSHGGFSNITLNATGKAAAGDEPDQFLAAITIAPDTVIKPVAESLLAISVPGSGPMTLQRFRQSESMRTPVSLTFGTPGTRDEFSGLVALRGDFVMGRGALIQTDPLGSVTIKGDTAAILGSIIAPGGNIAITGANSFPTVNAGGQTLPLPTVHLGSQSLLSTAGCLVLTPDAYGRRTGAVLPGGTISVSGNIVAQSGAVLDVSGASGIFDLPPSSLVENIPLTDGGDYRAVPINSGLTGPLWALRTVRTQVDSDAGVIALRGGQELFTDATLRGFAGGPSARGGELLISSGRFLDPVNPVSSPLDVNLIVTQSGATTPAGHDLRGGTAIGKVVPFAGTGINFGGGHFAADAFLRGGFDALHLSGIGGGVSGAVQFSGPVSISARGALSISNGGVIYADSKVFLEAPYVALGTSFQAPVLPNQTANLSFVGPNGPFYFSPTYGSGNLTVKASLIDLGNLSLQNIGRATFIADGGEIRGNGTLDVAGAIAMRASQIYPTTASRFTIAAYDPNVTVVASTTGSKEVALASPVLPPGFNVGSPLLGSKVAAIAGSVVTLEANANATITAKTPVTFAPGKGSVTIVGSSTPQLPLSAGGTLSVYASNIHQGGTLVAPLGAINLGWDGTGASPVDSISGAGIVPSRAVPVTQHLTLADGSYTSVAAIDPLTGEGVLIPYGFNANGTAWIDPTGADITGGSAPTKRVNLSGISVHAQAGSLIDVRGAGDLYAYRFVTGNGGTNDLLGAPSAEWSNSAKYTAGQLVSYRGQTYSARRPSSGVTPTISLDWTLVPQSFAVIPGYQPGYAPFAAFNNRVDALNLAVSDPGYVQSGLSVGDRIHLGASDGLASGNYTLLPARYAVLPGGVLVTPRIGAALGTFAQTDGSSLVSGYRFNDLNPQRIAPAQATRFEVAPSEVFRQRAQYDDYFANEFLRDSATALGSTIPRLPLDSGRIVISAVNALRLDGEIAGRASGEGHDAQIDLSSAADIYITGLGARGTSGKIVLSAAKLSSFGAESLLIGGIREFRPDGTTITVNTGKVTVDNAGTPLIGPEIILVAKTGLTLAPGASIVQLGSTQGSNAGDAARLRIGDAAVVGSGNGLLLRVSDQQVSVARAGITSLAEQAALGNPPVMTVGGGAVIFGKAITLDSTYSTTLDPAALIRGERISLNSGQISLEFVLPLADPPIVVPQIAGLMLAGPALRGLQSAKSLSLLSYSSIDLYGTGSFSTAGSVALHAAQIRGFHQGSGDVIFTAPRIVLDNRAGGMGLAANAALEGGLVLNAGSIRLGAGAVSIDQFATIDFDTRNGLVAAATGNVATQGALTISAPVITAAKAANYRVTANGDLNLLSGDGSGRSRGGGLGATLTLTGANVSVNTNIVLPSGSLTLHATTGDLLVGNLNATRLAAGGTARTFNDLIRYTDGGRITLLADAGSVTLGAASEIGVAAQAGGGNAGTVSISAANGTFALNGSLDGRGGAGGRSGTFLLDAKSLAEVSAVDATLNEAEFGEARFIRVRTGDVTIDGLASTHTYQLSADQGSITVTHTGNIDASGASGGNIRLVASESVTLRSGAQLTVAGEDFSSAGKGGEVSLEAGSQRDGVVSATGFVDIQGGATIELSVASVTGATPAEAAANTAAAALLGNFTGKLHLRAPQDTAGIDLQVAAIDGNVIGASSVLVEGYRLYDLTASGGAITTAVQSSINTNGQTFLGAAGTTLPNYGAMIARLLANNAALERAFVLAPGAEIINRTGNLTLGATNSNTTSDWNLSTFRYGAQSSAGVLTMRAAGDLVFHNALSDGFSPTLPSSNNAWLYRAELSPYNPLLPSNAQSWSYRLTAGADLGAVDFQQISALSNLGAGGGSLRLGKLVTTNNGNPIATGGLNAQTSSALANRYQVVRTGSGDITISAARDVQLLNQFATIYTAGTRTADPTLGGNFQAPPSTNIGPQGPLGATQQNPTYAAQYSLGGGNVTITAQQNIEHLTQAGGALVADSQKQMPNNWLYRRGYVDPVTGEFGITRDGEIGSTTWWVDFSNFFEGVGALGGGNVSLTAGNDISNVDALASTNARMTFQTATGDRLAANQSLIELGGGDVTVRAANNIDAGIYYVERGRGTLGAGGSIITNSTRTASLGTLESPANINPSPAQWLPTTLFLGKGGFDVMAGGDVLLGPVVNPFLLPGGVNNSFWRKSYFSTYSPTSEVNLTSLGGDITLRLSATRPGALSATPILQNWMEAVHVLTANPRSVSLLQPWLRLDETTSLGSLQPFSTVLGLLPGTVRSTAFSGDINLVGKLNLSPSSTGTIELAAASSINGLQINGSTPDAAGNFAPIWGSAKINLSDANPAAIPGVNSPFAYQTIVGTEASNAQVTIEDFLSFVDELFKETGSTIGAAASVQTQQSLHGTSLLHAADREPIRLYAGSGDISGLTLFSGKAAKIVAGADITDIALYIQNSDPADVSVVSAGGDIVAYNANSVLRSAAQAPGNLLNDGELPLAGDLQISGPGTFEVLAGRNLDLGAGENNSDGTGVGLTSIGNARNPNLPFAGADIIAAAGVGPALGLAGSTLEFERFIAQVIEGPDGARYLAELAQSQGHMPNALSGSGFEKLDPEQRAKMALEVFYLVLRDAGRDHTVEDSPGFENYDAGFAAVDALLGQTKAKGDITTRSRDIRTRSGGSISLLAPGGNLTLATSTIGTPLAPPGIITEAGGNISIFTDGDVDIGISRIFTLRGGNEIIWSTNGDIAAGSSSKTVQSAPPTRVLIDPQTAAVQTDLAGLATGGGIGVLATVAGVEPGNVDLIAPNGAVDAGDAGIRASGNLNIAAVQVLNADNIQVAGTSVGTPAPTVVAAPNLAGLAAASNAAGASTNAAQEVAKEARPDSTPVEEAPSIIIVEVIGYGGGDGSID